LISTAIDWLGPAKLLSSSVRSLRGGADDDCVLVLQHENGSISYLSGSALVGAPGPRIRLLGTQGALIINALDPQEALLRVGKAPTDGHWDVPTRSQTFLHRGDEVEEIASADGNYATFYAEVKGAIKGLNPWPVSTSDALLVAQIIDQARAQSVHLLQRNF